MKLALTAVMPAEGFNDAATAWKKTIGPMLASMREQLRSQVPMKGEFRVSILVDTLANAKTDEVSKAVHQQVISAN